MAVVCDGCVMALLVCVGCFNIYMYIIWSTIGVQHAWVVPFLANQMQPLLCVIPKPIVGGWEVFYPSVCKSKACEIIYVFV